MSDSKINSDNTIITLVSLVMLLVAGPLSAIAQTCTLDTSDARFQAEVYKLAARNSEPRKAFDGFKEYFGLSKTALDLVDNLQVGKFTRELQFIQAWHEPNKVVALNTSSANFSRWKVKIGPGGTPPGLVSKTVEVFGIVGHTLTGLSLAVNAYDAFSGDDSASKAAAVDIYKTSQGLLAAKYGTQSFSLAMVGVGFMDYALNKYMKTAYVKYEDYWWVGYSTYLNRTYSRASWAKLYQTRGQAGVDARLREFWADPYLNVGTNNQGKLRAMANDALASATYPEPFAARYMSEALVPRLNFYFKEKAEEARIDFEILLDQKCDLLAREIVKLRDLEKTIMAARVEMAKRAKEKEEKDKEDEEKTVEEAKGNDEDVAGEGAEDEQIDLANSEEIDDADWNEFLEFLSDSMEADEEDNTSADVPDEIGSGEIVNETDIIDVGNDDAEDAEYDDASDGQEQEGEDQEPSFDGLELEGTPGGVTDQSEWDDIEAEADANPQDYEDEDIDTTEEEIDDWDTIDEVDDTLYGADEGRINAVRDQMAGQVDADAGRIDAGARRDFADIEAERERRRIQKAKERAEFAAGMQALAQGLTEMQQAVQQKNNSFNQVTSGTTYTPTKPNPGLSGALKSCEQNLMSRANFPITDPYVARAMCQKSGGKPPPVPQYSAPPRVPTKPAPGLSYSQSGSQSTGGGDQCMAVAKGSKNPKRWGACCRAGGEMRYNAFSAPNGRVGISAYRCMQKGKPDEGKYMIDID